MNSSKEILDKVFVTKIGIVERDKVRKEFEAEIKPKVDSVNFVPNMEYLNDLLNANFHFAFILDDLSFQNFISDLQTISAFSYNKGIMTNWKKIRKKSFVFCLYSVEDRFRERILNSENNFLSKTHLDSIFVTILGLHSKNVNDPQEVFTDYLFEIQRKLSTSKLYKNIGGGFSFKFNISKGL